jgi:Fe-S cluster biogenesis protein NfuA
MVAVAIQFFFGHYEDFLRASCGAEGASFTTLDFDDNTTFRHAFLLARVVKGKVPKAYFIAPLVEGQGGLGYNSRCDLCSRVMSGSGGHSMSTITSPDTSNIPSKSTATAEERMRALIETLSSYIENFHGGSVELISFDGETLKIKMSGACLGCPLSPVTLHGWVEGTVKQFFPDLKAVESV